MNHAKISVVIPAYNSERYLESCLQAIASSEYANFEIIVVSDGSKDRTVQIAKNYADHVIELRKCKNRLQVRMAGFQASSGEIVVNIDSDVQIKKDSLQKIAEYFDTHTEFGAMTGLLAKESDVNNFFTTYKNLYMNYKFSRLPEKIGFLYGSIFALRRNVINLALQKFSHCTLQTRINDDSELGQLLTSLGIKIGLDKSLEVFHNKVYLLKTLLINDFCIPREFAKLFIHSKSKPTLTRGQPVFLHTLLSQLIAIAMAYLSLFGSVLFPKFLIFPLLLWFISNSSFFHFILRNKNLVFTFNAILFTFIDQVMMGLGIITGFLSHSKVAPETLFEGILVDKTWSKSNKIKN